jgi:Fur family transcriptional regulator, ferric uptake regulator
MKKSRAADEIAELKALLRKSGLRSTSARLAVLQNLQKARTPISHAELAKDLVPTGLDRATVYRNLMDLAESGLVARAELGDHVWRYEIKREGHHHNAEHPHFVCIDCGEVTCLTDVDVAISPTPGSKKSTIAGLTEVLLKGHCGKCV